MEYISRSSVSSALSERQERQEQGLPEGFVEARRLRSAPNVSFTLSRQTPQHTHCVGSPTSRAPVGVSLLSSGFYICMNMDD